MHCLTRDRQTPPPPPRSCRPSPATESLGYVDIHLRDVVYNGRMNEDMLIYMLIYGGR
nr:hypothetical protein Iba_chr02aCG22400 [Ipomoea batatas]